MIGQTFLKTLMPALLMSLVFGLHSNSFAQAQTNKATTSGANAATSNDGALTREEILALFQREARAGYEMNKQACEGLPAEDKRLCLAKARLQFDEDMRYAQKRANMGY